MEDRRSNSIRTELRSHTRYPIPFLAWPAKVDSTTMSQAGICTDASETGLGIQVSNSIRLSDIVQISVSPQNGPAFILSGTVVHASGKQHAQIGVALLKPVSNYIKALKKVCPKQPHIAKAQNIGYI